MAAASYEALTSEIDRITASPYPSQLRTLRDIATKCNDAHISLWAATKPCLVDTLVSCLLEGLHQWSYVLDIVTRFAYNTACRDAFLRQAPSLLHSVVAQAVKTGDAKSKYARASVALLSGPLPNTVALPAEVQALFVQLVEEAAKHPSSATIEPVYLLLNGTGSLLLGVLSNEVLIRFEEKLLEVLRHGSGSPEQSLCLYCLSIMNVVCCSTDPQFRLTASSYTSQDFLASTPTSSRWKSEAMQKYFAGSRAEKSIQLLVLNVVWAAGNVSAGESASEKIKSLVLANELIAAMPVDLRKKWCAANTITIRKLQEKLCNHTQDETAKTLALRFLGKLCDLDSLPHPVLDGIERTFLEPKTVQIARLLCPRVHDCELFSSVLARTPISMLLQNAVDYASRAESIEVASGLEAMTLTIQDALAIIEVEQITGHEIRATLSDAAFAQSLQRLADLLQAPLAHDQESGKSGWCPRALHRARSNLAHQISSLLLRACHSSSMSPQSMSVLLGLHASSAKGDLQCSHDRISWREHVALAGGRDDVEEDLGDWREALHTHFKARAQVEQDAVARLFTRACASLESRCQNVEKPLRDEQKKRQALEERNEDLMRAFAEMEARNIEKEISARALEEERDRHVQELEACRDENDDLLVRVAELEKQLQDTQAQVEAQVAESKHSKQVLDLESAAVIARKQEELEDMGDQLQRATRDAASKAEDMERMQEELASARSDRDRLKVNLASTNARLKEAEDHVDAVERNKVDFAAQSASLKLELSTAQNELSNRAQELAGVNQQLQDSQAKHDALRASFERELADLREDFNAKYEVARIEARHHQDTADSLERQIALLHHEQEEAQAHYTTTVEAHGATTAALHKKISHLHRKCQQKDAQIADAEALRANLMAAMGISASAPPHRSRDSLPQTQDDPTPPTPSSAAGDPDVEMETPEAEPQRTPKRPRPRKSAPAAAGKGSSTQMPGKRQTLGVVSGNRRSGVGGGACQTSGKGEGEGEGEGDGSTFEGSELFSGTQGVEMQLQTGV